MIYGGSHAPEWASDLLIAKEAGIRPWEIEDMPAVWYVRIRTWLECKHMAEKAATRG